MSLQLKSKESKRGGKTQYHCLNREKIMVKF
jgi:hypothetical protein